MPEYQYIAVGVEEKAKKYNLLDRVREKLRNARERAILERQDLHFSRLNQNFRMVCVAIRHSHEPAVHPEDWITGAVDIMKHDEYERQRDTITCDYAQKYKREIREFIKRYRHDVISRERMKELSRDEKDWLCEYVTPVDMYVLEGRNFVIPTGALEDIREELVSIYCEPPEDGLHIRKTSAGYLAFYYCRRLKVLILFGLGQNSRAIEVLCRDISQSDDIDRATNIVSGKMLYPFELVGEKEIWEALHVFNDASKANLALSNEEKNLLDRVMAGEKGALPLFIHGRAGSGKSTLLFYLFARCLDRYYTIYSSLPPPIFITYSTALKKHAASMVRLIFNVGHYWTREQNEIETVDFNAHFTTLIDHIRSLLPQGAQELFPETRRMNYFTFVRYWEKYVSHRNIQIDPEIAWHVIRSHIKGSKVLREWHIENDILKASDGGLTPDEYSQGIGMRKEKTVDDETYRKVYQEVWKNWYRALPYWDDQDIASYLLAHTNHLILEEKARSAVFCDEAQDFTKVELEVILKSFLFTHRVLECHYLDKLPLFFAGDPLQTINPTIFRWEALTSILYSLLAENIRESSQSNCRIKLHKAELKNNYRSHEDIVSFSNRILFLRSILENTDLRTEPQEVWICQR